MIIIGITPGESGRQDDAYSGFTDGSSVATGYTLAVAPLPGTPGSLATPTATPLDPATAGANRGYAGDFYYRIWAIPLVLRATNPRVGVPIAFHLWNAFPEDNVLETIAATGASTLTLDVAELSSFKPIEFRKVNLTIINATIVNIEAHYTFTFDEGSTPFSFLATVVQFLGIRPDVPVVETVEWLTDILRSFNGSEQRMSLRTYPRKTISYTLLLESEDQRREQYDRWYRSTGFDVMIPAFQYSGTIQQDALVGDTTIYVNTENVDIRDGETGLLLDPYTEESEFVTVDTVASDHLVLISSIQADHPKGHVFAPIHRSRVVDKTGVSMQTVTGQVNVKAQVFDDRTSFPRPSSAAVIETVSGWNLLNRRPMVDGDVQELFERGFETLDNETGQPDIRRAWPHAFVQGTRKFLIHRELDPTDMDYWRDFLDACNGMQNPFLFSTYRNDLTITELPGVGGSTIGIGEGKYVEDYFPYETYKYLEMETQDGFILRSKVVSAIDNGDGTATLNLAEAFETSLVVTRISFLNLVRLNSDTVQLEHDHIDSTIAISIRAIDA